MTDMAEIEIAFEEDAENTEARASLLLRGARFTGFGRARRNPSDPSLPMVGEELAAARALSDLTHKLLDAAARAISEGEGRPAQINL
jgi:hypothetical protein